MLKNEPIIMPKPEMIEEYVNKAVKEARIDELVKLKSEFENRVEDTFTAYHFIEAIDNHISKIKGETE